jgi:hypothetical protein
MRQIRPTAWPGPFDGGPAAPLARRGSTSGDGSHGAWSASGRLADRCASLLPPRAREPAGSRRTPAWEIPGVRDVRSVALSPAEPRRTVVLGGPNGLPRTECAVCHGRGWPPEAPTGGDLVTTVRRPKPATPVPPRVRVRATTRAATVPEPSRTPGGVPPRIVSGAHPTGTSVPPHPTASRAGVPFSHRCGRRCGCPESHGGNRATWQMRNASGWHVVKTFVHRSLPACGHPPSPTPPR